ncbi:MAG: hypothetical protein Q9195_001988 [Heterodermia aff. obscurata]
MDWRPEQVHRHHGNLPIESEPTETATPATRPLSERIGTSTRALIRDTILRPSPQITLDTLASVSSRTEKGDSSSSVDATSLAETSSWRSSSASCDQILDPSQALNEPFRTYATHHNAQRASSDAFNFDDFLASQPEPLSRSVEAPLNSRGTNQLDGSERPNNGPNGHSLHADVQRSVTDHVIVSDNCQTHRRHSETWCQTHRRHSETWQHDNTRPTIDPDEDPRDYDGAEVVALLSGPGSFLDEVAVDDEHCAQPEMLDRHPPFYAAQIGEVVHPDVVANELQLVPNLSSNPTAFEMMIDSMPHIDKYSQDIDLQPWLKILDSYHDEVWGDILPLVQEARNEAKPAKYGMWKSEDKPALRRLQMVLRHLHT